MSGQPARWAVRLRQWR